MSLSRSWQLMKDSARVVKADKELLWMPVLSAIASIVTVLAIMGIGISIGMFDAQGNVSGPGLALAALLYVSLAFVTLFFNAAVVAAATERLDGGDPTVKSALAAAWKRKGRLFMWAIVVATVNVILQAIRERSGMVGQIMAGLAGIAWNLATYFMVPVLLFDDKRIGDSLKHSGGLFKKTWGETVVGEGGLGLAAFLVTAGVAVVGFILMQGLGALLGAGGLIFGLVLTVFAVLLSIVFFSVLQGVYKAALYRYATKGDGGEFFRTDVLAGTFH